MKYGKGTARRILSALLVLVMCFGMLPRTVLATDEDNHFSIAVPSKEVVASASLADDMPRQVSDENVTVHTTKDLNLLVYKVFKGYRGTELPASVILNTQTKEPVMKYTYKITHVDIPLGGKSFEPITGTMEWRYLGTSTPSGVTGVAAYQYAATVAIPSDVDYFMLEVTEPKGADGKYPMNIDGYRWKYESGTWQASGSYTYEADETIVFNFVDSYAKILTVTWMDEDGTVLDGPKEFLKGEPEPARTIQNPAKHADGNFTYGFKEWRRDVDGEGNVTYGATYTACGYGSYKQYIFTFFSNICMCA